MKYCIIILLSILMFFNSSLFTIIYSVKILGINDKASEFCMNTEDENIERINADGIFILKIKLSPGCEYAKKNIKWINETEFILDGYYCDIVTKRIINDTLNIFYIHDKEEDELNYIYTLNFENGNSSKGVSQYFNVLFSFLSNAHFYTKYILYPPHYTKNLQVQNSLTCLINKPDVPEPPPKSCS